MAKKKTAKAKKKTAKKPRNKTEPEVAATPEVEAAAEAVCKAKSELQKAQEMYQNIREETTDRLKAMREKTVGDLVDDTLETVKKHPGPALVVAGVLGLLLGRLFGNLFSR